MLRPFSLINSHGKPYLGRFVQAVNEINVKDADYRTPLNKKATKRQKHFRFKQFQYFGGISKDYIFGCALADLRYIGAVFVYVYKISDGSIRTWQFKRPLSIGLNMTHRPDNGVSSFTSLKKKIHMGYELNSNGDRKKILDIDFGTELQIHAEMRESRHYEPMVLCTPTGVNGWTYAQKTAALQVSGMLEIDDRTIDLEEQHCHGHHDLSAGYMRRETFWNWACFSGTENDKHRALGLNVSWGVNETGFSENCFWVEDKLHPLPLVQFKFNRDDEHSAWRITSANKQIDLSFKPLGLHKEKVNAGFVASNFKQFYGVFNGYLRTAEGTLYTVENQYGFVEDQFARW